MASRSREAGRLPESMAGGCGGAEPGGDLISRRKRSTRTDRASPGSSTRCHLRSCFGSCAR
jgi:hypothetical protein